jgi:hypothetical protein
MVETVVLLITGTVVGATMLPGFTLCIPCWPRGRSSFSSPLWP